MLAACVPGRSVVLHPKRQKLQNSCRRLKLQIQLLKLQIPRGFLFKLLKNATYNQSTEIRSSDLVCRQKLGSQDLLQKPALCIPHKGPPSAFQVVKLRLHWEAHNLHGCKTTKLNS